MFKPLAQYKKQMLNYINDDVLALFPRETSGGTAIDENCQCGHMRSAHFNRTIFTAGHGECSRNCGCKQFTWAGWVYKTKRRRK